MRVSQFTESRKAQMVEQYRAGASSSVVARRFGCSDRTVMRLARARLGAAEFEDLKQQNRRRSVQSTTTAVTTPAPAAAASRSPSSAAQNKPAGSDVGPFTESRKAQMVEQYRAGASSSVVARRFGCSDRTVMRLARARLDAAEFEALKQQNRRRSAQSTTTATTTPTTPTTPAPAAATSRKSSSAAQNKPADSDVGPFTESRKAQMVEQYRAGASSSVVAKRFGCSDRTVMRLARARLDAAEFEALKQQNRRRSAQSTATATTTPAPAAAASRKPSSAAQNKPAGSDVGPFTESRKAQMVEQYRAGASSSVVAKRFGCSDRTVMRLARARLGAAEFEDLKQQNRRRSAQSTATATTTPAPAAAASRSPSSAAQNKPADSDVGPFTESRKAQMVEQYRAGASSSVVAKRFGCSDRTVMRLARARLGAAEFEALKQQNRRRSAQPRPTAAVGNSNAMAAQQPTEAARATSLDVNQLPSPLYFLVDRSVELQPQSLGSLHHLGSLTTDEQQRQGLVLFSNVRQARRQCRRNQRVVKLVDPKLLGKTAPRLLAQGISRLVIEDALYALPGSTAPAQP